MINIRHQFDRFSNSKADRGYTNPGDAEKVTYTSYYDSRGILQLEEDGKINLYEEIQSHKDSTDIHVLIERFHQGDLSIMERLQTERGAYVDATNMPKTYAEVLNLIHRGEQEFMQLPVEVRAEFNHDYAQWMAAMDDMPVWAKRMGFDKQEQQANQINDLGSSAPAPAPVPDTTGGVSE